MNEPGIDIESLIPHRDRLRLVDEVLAVTAETAVVSALVKSTWPSCEDGRVNPIVLIEVVAQAAAVIDGTKRKKQGKSGVKGWLVGVKNARFNVTEIPVGTKLVASVKSSYTLDNYSVVQGSIKVGEEELAEIILQAIEINEDPTDK